jgi:hypothetical protein
MTVGGDDAPAQQISPLLVVGRYGNAQFPVPTFDRGRWQLLPPRVEQTNDGHPHRLVEGQYDGLGRMFEYGIGRGRDERGVPPDKRRPGQQPGGQKKDTFH